MTRPTLPHFKRGASAPTPASDRAAKPEQSLAVPVRLSIAKAAERAGVSDRTVKRWIAAGRLEATRLPSPKGRGHLRVRLGDLEALLAQGTLS